MCNIAAYAGNKKAVPILLEMLRKQRAYDGGMSVGVATIHEGKLYWKKMVGTVDQFIAETDVLSMPGTIGIAHTRPAGGPGLYEFAHPYLSQNEDMAVVSNGTTPKTKYSDAKDEVLRMLEEKGYKFRATVKDENSSWPRLKDGTAVGTADVRVKLVEYYLDNGCSYTEAMVKMASDLFTDNVSVMINQNAPDKIFALRTTRPMVALFGENETYMATTRFAFPEDVDGHTMDLPILHACVIAKDGLTVTKDKMDCEGVDEMNPYIYAEAYERFVKLLKGKKDTPLYFDDLEFAVGREMRDLWPNNRTFIQHARLVYDILVRLESEGRLKSEIRDQQVKLGTRKRKYMWIEE